MSVFGENYHKNDLVDYIEIFFKEGGTIEDMFDVLKYVFEFGNTPIDKLQQELTKYKERCEKAVEYIKQLEHSDWITFGRKILLEILQDKENK